MTGETKQAAKHNAFDIILEQHKKDWPEFGVGDTVQVHYKIKEGDKQRIQVYEGVVITNRGSGVNRTFIVRRISHSVGVERIFPYHSPSIEKIVVVRRGKVRRARLYYLRSKSGKEGRIKEVRDTTRPVKKVKKAAPVKTEPQTATPQAEASNAAAEPATAAPQVTEQAAVEQPITEQPAAEQQAAATPEKTQES